MQCGQVSFHCFFGEVGSEEFSAECVIAVEFYFVIGKVRNDCLANSHFIASPSRNAKRSGRDCTVDGVAGSMILVDKYFWRRKRMRWH